MIDNYKAYLLIEKLFMIMIYDTNKFMIVNLLQYTRHSNSKFLKEMESIFLEILPQITIKHCFLQKFLFH